MTPQQIIFLSIVGIALVALIFLSESQKRYNLDSIKRKTVGDGQYGTARWATQEEIQSSTIQVPYEPEAWRYNKESRPTTAGIVINLKQNKKQILATIDPSDSHTLMVAGTGGGKTTIARLIPRFFDVQAGAVLLCGRDVRSIPTAELMEQISFVFQEVRLFKKSIRDNLSLIHISEPTRPY